jgi:outer membrane receptor for ferrienterochelin and colicins
VNYGATQQVLFSNLIWENKIGKRHFLVSGLTNRWMTYEDNTPSMTDENAYIPGVFVQDEFTWSDDFVMLGGARLDHHQRHGFIFAPRFSIKKTFKTYTTVRANYGNGFRQVFLFTEDHAFVSGARDVVILSDLLPERSHNVTLNLNHTYTVGGYGNFDIDLFYMHFSNKIIPDFDTDPNLIIYDNLAGLGVSRGASLAINHKFKIPLRVKLGATFMDVYEEEPNELDGTIQRTDQVFAPKFSGVFGVKYQWNKLGITIDYTGRVVGPKRLPTAPDGFEIDAYSDWFSLQHIQLTKTFKKQNIEIFGGVKNIFNYTQGSPLIDPQNPFGDSFDTAFAYGPLQVRRFFFGLRYGLKRK